MTPDGHSATCTTQYSNSTNPPNNAINTFGNSVESPPLNRINYTLFVVLYSQWLFAVCALFWSGRFPQTERISVADDDEIRSLIVIYPSFQYIPITWISGFRLLFSDSKSLRMICFKVVAGRKDRKICCGVLWVQRNRSQKLLNAWPLEANWLFVLLMEYCWSKLMW